MTNQADTTTFKLMLDDGTTAVYFVEAGNQTYRVEIELDEDAIDPREEDAAEAPKASDIEAFEAGEVLRFTIQDMTGEYILGCGDFYGLDRQWPLKAASASIAVLAAEAA